MNVLSIYNQLSPKTKVFCKYILNIFSDQSEACNNLQLKNLALYKKKLTSPALNHLTLKLPNNHQFKIYHGCT